MSLLTSSFFRLKRRPRFFYLHPHRLSASYSSLTPRPSPSTSTSTPQPSPSQLHPSLVQEVIATYLPSIRSLAAKLPHLRRPPTPTDLLPLTDSFLDRLQIRFKWLTIRSFRPYRPDDYSAFASLLVVLALLLAALTTTSFLGVLLLIFNKAGLEDLVARWLSDYLSRSTGVRILFASALVPRWRDGLIRFENVLVSRGPLAEEPSQLFHQILLDHNIHDCPPIPAFHSGRRHILDRSPLHHHPDADHLQDPFIQQHLVYEPPPASQSQSPVDPSFDTQNPANITYFYLTITSIDVTLSLRRWLDGKGLIRQASVSGVRGVVDRSHLPTAVLSDTVEILDRAASRRKPAAGDFDLEQLLVDDLLVTIYQPSHFRPYTFSIFGAQVSRLRKQWLFLDLLSADQVTGQLDNCLFSLHRPQSLTRSNLPPQPTPSRRYETHLSRFRIDGVPIDHLQSRLDPGPLGWISSGKVDLVADIRLPRQSDNLDLRSVVKEIVDNFEKELVPTAARISERPKLVKPALEAPLAAEEGSRQDEVVIQMDIRFKDVKATLFSSNLSYVNHALVRPIVAFINANKTLIPIRCSVALSLDDFDGSWTAYEIGLVEAIAAQVYSALAHHVSAEGRAARRAGLVGLWSVQLTARALLGALRQHWEAAH